MKLYTKLTFQPFSHPLWNVAVATWKELSLTFPVFVFRSVGLVYCEKANKMCQHLCNHTISHLFVISKGEKWLPVVVQLIKAEICPKSEYWSEDIQKKWVMCWCGRNRTLGQQDSTMSLFALLMFVRLYLGLTTNYIFLLSQKTWPVTQLNLDVIC